MLMLLIVVAGAYLLAVFALAEHKVPGFNWWAFWITMGIYGSFVGFREAPGVTPPRGLVEHLVAYSSVLLVPTVLATVIGIVSRKK